MLHKGNHNYSINRYLRYRIILNNGKYEYIIWIKIELKNILIIEKLEKKN